MAEIQQTNDVNEIQGNCVLSSRDGVQFEIPKAVAMLSKLAREMINEDTEYNDEGEDTEIPLPNVDGNILKLVVDFCKHYHEDPMKEIERPLKTSNMSDAVSKWYAEFIDSVDQKTLISIIVAANYMDIGPLLNLSCSKVSALIMGKTPKEVRDIFEIENDFTEEDAEKIRKENEW